jgi:UDP-N-acetylmuramoylalanine--D-glutamate ligase
MGAGSGGIRLADLEAGAIAAGSLRGVLTVVLGAGRTGQAAAAFAAAAGAQVTLHDTAAAATLEAATTALQGSGVTFAFGPDAPLAPLLDTAQLVVHSPSVTLGFPSVKEQVAAPLSAFAARALPLGGDREARGVILISEPEWTLRLLGNRTVVGVTGTKGKTTTTALIAAILAADPSRPVELGGNNGRPLIGHATSLAANARVVMEISELQLPSIVSSVKVGVYTNITVDHLDRHGTVDRYRAVKRLLAARVADDGVLIVNLDDPVTAGLAGEGRVTTIGYRREAPIPGGVGIVDGWIVAAGVAGPTGAAAATGPGGRIAPVGEIALIGDHSVSNVLAAVAAGLALGVAPDAIRRAITSFTGVPHRLEPIALIDGIRYVDDSQATQPDAVAAALRSFEQPLILVAGGRSKGADLHDLARVVAERCSAAVVMGELSDELESTFRAAGLARIERSSGGIDGATLAAARLAREVATPTGSVRATVLLSPIGSSFDMFNNPFGARGDAFKDAVRRLAAGELV